VGSAQESRGRGRDHGGCADWRLEEGGGANKRGPQYGDTGVQLLQRQRRRKVGPAEHRACRREEWHRHAGPRWQREQERARGRENCRRQVEPTCQAARARGRPCWAGLG
jgi:hypothetical protein